eukprot:Selendium_serpulae@DN9882_c0_g1_i1.p1
MSLIIEAVSNNGKIIVFFSNCCTVDFVKAWLDVVNWPSEEIVDASVRRRDQLRSRQQPSKKLKTKNGWIAEKSAFGNDEDEGVESDSSRDSDDEMNMAVTKKRLGSG